MAAERDRSGLMNGDDNNDWMTPALIFFAGAVIGRVLGVKTLVRGTLAAATLAGIGQAVGSAMASNEDAPERIAHDTPRKAPQKRAKGRG
jgi:hypothetical protein